MKPRHSKKLESIRQGFGASLVEIGAENEKIIVLSADLVSSTRVSGFSQQFPERFLEIGIAEQDIMGIAAGLSFRGKIPIIANYAAFVPGRCYDQLRQSIAFNNANVKICSSHAGIQTGPDGASHQSIEDIALARALPNFTVIAPVDSIQIQKALRQAINLDGPVFIRYSRNKTPIITKPNSEFKIGKAQVMRKGQDVTIIACGTMLAKSLHAAKFLAKKGIGARVINCHTIKPIDKDTIIEAARQTKAIVTVEDHSVFGGLGSAVSEVIVQNNPVPMKIIGINDRFGQSGSAKKLLEEYGLTVENIVKNVELLVKAKT